MKSEINILITGSGSVLGMSIFKALNFSKYAEHLNVYYTNSEPVGAGFFFNSTGFYKVKVLENFLVPIAKSPDYIPKIKQICEEKHIDLIFGGTEHEIYALAELQKEQGYENKVMGLPLNFVDMTTDKYKTFLFFDKYGIDTPKTALFEEIKEFTKKYGYPVFIKPRKNSASRNIKKINSEDEIPQGLENMIVQEYIGSVSEEYTVGCYLDRISLKDNYIIMKRTLTPDGASGLGQVIKDEKIENYCIKIMEGFKKEGFKGGAFNVQLRLRNDLPCAFEINGRYSSTEGPRAKMGFNAVEATIENVIFNREYKEFNPEEGKNFLRYYEEVYW